MTTKSSKDSDVQHFEFLTKNLKFKFSLKSKYLNVLIFKQENR